MSEVVNGRELKGLGGWLVLFQIQIWSTLAGAVQMMILFPLLGMLFKKMLASEIFYPYDATFGIFELYSSPVVVISAAVIFVLTLLCVIYFYKKRLVFRTFFIIESVLYFAGMLVLYYFIIMSVGNMYMSYGIADSFTTIYTIMMVLFGLIPALGIMIAFIIALYKSKRVKNTFS